MTTEQEIKEQEALDAIKPEEGSDEYEFDAAFEELSSEEDPEAKVKADKEAAAKLAAEAAEKEVTPADSIYNPSPAEEDTEDVDDEVVLTPEEEIAKLKADALKEKQKTASWEGRINAANKRAADAELKASQSSDLKDKGQSNNALPDGDDDDELVINEFTEEFPALEKPIQVMIRKEARKIVAESLKEVAPKIKAVEDTLVTSARESHLGNITKAHEDWIEIRDSGKLQTWIDAQPSFLRDSLQNVYVNGNTAQVIEMFDAYKNSNSLTQTRETNPKPKVNPKAKKLLAVSHQSAGVPKQAVVPDKDDFDATWDAIT